MNDENKNTDTAEPASESPQDKQEKVKEKLQTMGVMADDKNTSPENADVKNEKSHKVKLSILAILLTSGFLYWISTTKDAHEQRFNMPHDTSSKMSEGSKPSVATVKPAPVIPKNNMNRQPVPLTKNTRPAPRATFNSRPGTAQNQNRNLYRNPYQNSYPYRQTPRPQTNNQYQYYPYPPYGGPWMPPYPPAYRYTPGYPGPTPYYR